MTPLDRFLQRVAGFIARQPEAERFAMVLLGADLQGADVAMSSPLTEESIRVLLRSALANAEHATDTPYNPRAE